MLTLCLAAVKNMLSSTVKWYMRDPVKTYFGPLIKNAGEILDKPKARNFNATSLLLIIFFYSLHHLTS